MESLNTWQAHPEGITGISFHPSGTYLASGGKDKYVRIWSIPDCSLTAGWEAHNLAVVSVEFSPDGRSLASGSVNEVLVQRRRRYKLWSFDAAPVGASSLKSRPGPVMAQKTEPRVSTSQKDLQLVIGNGQLSFVGSC